VVCDTPESRLMPNEGQHISRHILSCRKKLGLSCHGAGVTLRRRYCRACQGGRLHRIDTRTKVDRWKTLFDYLNPAYLCMTVHGGILADLSNHVGKVYNLCRVYIYSNSRVLGHGRLGRPLLSPMLVFGFKMILWKTEKGARRSTRRVLSWHDGVWSTCRVLPRNWTWSCLIDHGSLKNKRVPPSLDILLKLVL
jgi:hypothetical protein